VTKNGGYTRRLGHHESDSRLCRVVNNRSQSTFVSVTEEAVSMTGLLFAYAVLGVAPFFCQTATGTA
jgi:hypothetical protein